MFDEVFMDDERRMDGLSRDFTMKDYVECLESGSLAKCDRTGKFFNDRKVEVTSRYADCSMFKCPQCKKEHDDRINFNSRGNRNKRNGYTKIQNPFYDLDEFNW